MKGWGFKMSKNPYMFVNYGLVSGDKPITPYQGAGYDVYILDVSEDLSDSYNEIARLVKTLALSEGDYLGFLSPSEAKEFYYDILSLIRERNLIIHPKSKRARVYKRGALFQGKKLKNPFEYEVDFSNVIEKHHLLNEFPYNDKVILSHTPHILWAIDGWRGDEEYRYAQKNLIVFKPYVPKYKPRQKDLNLKFEKYQKDLKWALEGKEARRR